MIGQMLTSVTTVHNKIVNFLSNLSPYIVFLFQVLVACLSYIENLEALTATISFSIFTCGCVLHLKATIKLRPK